jgi:hypothetical protein
MGILPPAQSTEYDTRSGSEAREDNIANKSTSAGTEECVAVFVFFALGTRGVVVIMMGIKIATSMATPALR